MTATSQPTPQTASAPVPALRIVGLSVSIRKRDGQRMPVLDGLNFELQSRQITGLLGESGAGKTTLALALLRMLPDCFETEAKSMELCGQQILSLSERELQMVRGAHISIVHQDTACLNPVLRCGTQIVEVLRAHQQGSLDTCREEARRLLRAVGLADERFFRVYPHQLSGGQRQRVAIAQAVACKPAIVITDEPTASLDARSAVDILRLFRDLSERFQTAFLVITHQPQIIALADRALVMHSGRIVEEAAIPKLLEAPTHPYTRQLLACRHPLTPFPPPSIAAHETKPRWPCIAQDGLESGAATGRQEAEKARCNQGALQTCDALSGLAQQGVDR